MKWVLEAMVRGHKQMENIVQSLPMVGFGSVKYEPSCEDVYV